ncbi:MAG: LysM peptidoglycan-binding domain-containing protein [Candidatus Azobacteroides sp.]|nr:LysM peptidoglycan-binding domain-containing protein [Candidatus Azobacteroides sp.]
MIRNLPFLSAIILGFALSLNVLSQTTNNYRVVQINGINYYIYTVQPAEGLYSVSKRFNISRDDIMAANPEIKDGLKNGQEIRIPIKNDGSTSTPTSTAVRQSNAFNHTVSPGETLYSIAASYGTTVDEICRLNPEIEKNNVIKVGSILKIPQQGNGNVSDDYIYHTIQEGETLYSVSKKYGLTVDGVLETNPGLSPATFNTGKVIRLDAKKVSAFQKAKAEKEKNESGTFLYIAEKNEKIEEIATKFNVSVSELKKVNPDLPKKLSKGQKIQIPSLKSKIPDIPAQQQPPTPVKSAASVNTTPQIALLLPFMLNDNSKKSERDKFVEYYEGFLMALNEAKSDGFSANVYVYDTNTNEADVKKILERNEMKKMNLIIGPVYDNLIPALSSFSSANNIPLVIPFTSKNDSYQTNSNIFQINTPQNYLYPKVCEAFITEFKKYNVIILRSGGSADDKTDFISSLTSALKQEGIAYRDVTLSESSATGTLEAALSSSKDNMIVPVFSTSASLDKYLPQVIKLKENKHDLTIKLFGYPEWQTYSKNIRNKFLHPLDTYIYSMFYADMSSFSITRFRTEFTKAYSKDIKLSFPKFGLLGYDTGKYFLKALQKYGTDFQSDISSFYQSGLQMDYHFERVNYWSGFINKSIYFIRYNPNSNIDATVYR